MIGQSWYCSYVPDYLMCWDQNWSNYRQSEAGWQGYIQPAERTIFSLQPFPLAYCSRLGAKFGNCLLKRHVAGAHNTRQDHSTYADQHVRGLYQPVQITSENTRLRQTKDRHDQGVHDADNAPDPHTSGADSYNTHDQQSKGYDKAKQHMNANQVNVSDPE